MFQQTTHTPLTSPAESFTGALLLTWLWVNISCNLFALRNRFGFSLTPASSKAGPSQSDGPPPSSPSVKLGRGEGREGPTPLAERPHYRARGCVASKAPRPDVQSKAHQVAFNPFTTKRADRWRFSRQMFSTPNFFFLISRQPLVVSLLIFIEVAVTVPRDA